MNAHPYKGLPDYRFWSSAALRTPMQDVDPVIRAKFTINSSDKVATAGSCFAQHIARHLQEAGFNYFVTESAHPIVQPDAAKRFSYGLFTARYGNIYTARQLLQLLKRAFGLFHPTDDVWRNDDGRIFDPFRPQIQPNGFSTIEEYEADRRQHFAAVRKAVESLDVFVFTLGLTETWASKEDGAVYPLCPGVAAGNYEPSRHMFINLSVKEVIDDMDAAASFIFAKNPKARLILTVSPVPLVATFEDKSAIVSTTYSKSVLRVACEELSRHNRIAYFPSYEIITGNFNRGAYFGRDLRSVTESGVSHVMRLFMRHYASAGAELPNAAEGGEPTLLEQSEKIVAVLCDEEALAR